MATKKDSSTKVAIRVATGTTPEGKTVFADRTIPNFNSTLTDETVCSIGAGYASLQANVLAGVIRTHTDIFEID